MFNLDCQPEMEPNEHVADLQKIFNSSYNKVREKMDLVHKRQKEYYNQKVHGTPYQVGAFLCHCQPQGKKQEVKSFMDGTMFSCKRTV